MQCKRHPETETNLACGKCGEPICPRCLVQTPVGARCPACARLSRIPTYRVTGKYYLIAIGAGLGAALAAGLAWGFIESLVRYFYIIFLIAAAAGYGTGEAISLSVNRKRGPGLQIIAGLAVVAAYAVSAFTFWDLRFNLYDILAIVLGVFVAVTRLR